MRPIEMPGPTLPTDDTGYFEVQLLPRQRRWLLDALRAYKPTRTNDQLQKGTLQELELARKINLALPRPQDRVDWEALEEEAQKRGSSLADLLWDKAKS